MSLKRTASESFNKDDDQQNDCISCPSYTLHSRFLVEDISWHTYCFVGRSPSSANFQQNDNAKRAKLTLSNDTKLQDLPPELLECLLVKAVVSEVRSMRLAKRVWKEKADLAIRRLSTVCSQWTNILTSKLFRNEVHKTLDSTAQETIRVRNLQQSPIQLAVVQVTAMEDEIFLLCSAEDGLASIAVYDRSNTGEVKNVIALPEITALDIVACKASNCVYVLGKKSEVFSVLRITKEEEHQFSISPWICDLRTAEKFSISVTSDGNLLVLSRGYLTDAVLAGQRLQDPTFVRVYDPSGSLQQEIALSSDIFCLRYVFRVIQKSKGNLLLVSINRLKLLITEIDWTVRIVRQCQSELNAGVHSNLVDVQGRTLLMDWHGQMEVFDCELNRLDFAEQKQYVGQFKSSGNLHYNADGNEIVSVCKLVNPPYSNVLTVFRNSEE